MGLFSDLDGESVWVFTPGRVQIMANDRVGVRPPSDSRSW
jgi:hypothetical protein